MEDAIAAACAYARKRLAEELPATLTYHSIAHTEQVAVPAATALAIAAGVDDESRALLEVAAWFHDLGYIVRYDHNEPVAVELARTVLPGLGFAPAEVAAIEGMIWATQLPQRPTTLLEELMADADLDAFGRDDFWEIEESLRQEWATYREPVDEREWTEKQIGFLGSHTYFSDAAKARNDAAKARHLRVLEQRLEELRNRPETPVRATVAAHASLAPFLARDRRRALAEGRALPQVVHGAALFADISGFTPLTEALARTLGPQRGAEELSSHLGVVFTGVIEHVHDFGGEVLNFSGDAITCWLDGDDGARAVACAVAIQRTMAEIGRITTSTGEEVVLSIKVAIAVGDAHRFAVGDESIQLLDVLAGTLMDELAGAEHVAEPTDVVLAASAVRALGDRVTVTNPRGGADDSGAQLLASSRTTAAKLESPPDPELSEEVIRPWLLPVIYERLRGGRGEFLAELRPAFAMFVRFGGFDVDVDPEAVHDLDEFVRACQGAVTRYGGNVVQLTHGDKGAYLYAVFGAPHAHEDDGARAASAALEVLDLERTTGASDLQIGLTHGRIYSGTYGHPRRLAFSCLGDITNLSARLMMRAPAGQIYASDEVRTAAGAQFQWEPVGNLLLKGKANPVATYRLVGADDTAGTVSRGRLPIVGRERELAQLVKARDDALDGRRRVVALAGEGGYGKSRLMMDVADDLERAGATVVRGSADAFGRIHSYRIWRGAARQLFGLDPRAPVSEQVESVERALELVSPGYSQRAPLVGPVVGLDVADNDLTASFDAKLRKTSLEALLADTFRARASAGPIAVLLDDAQWIDDLSVDLLDALVRATDDQPVLFVVAYRPGDVAPDAFGLARHQGFELVEVGALDAAGAESIVTDKVADLWGAEVVAAPEVVAFTVDRSHGNPFYIESILEWIRSRGLDPSEPITVRGLDLPTSLQSLVLSRMDAIEESPRQTLKVASVIGRTFGTDMLGGVYPELGRVDALEHNLSVLDAAELVEHTDDAANWWFRQVLTHEVAYESLPFSLRAELHGRAGAFVEGQQGADLDLLAHHYWHSGDAAKKIEYLDRAGAAAQARYANAAAIDYLERLAGLLRGPKRADALLRLGKVLALVGDWSRARETVDEASALSLANDDSVGVAWCDVALAELDRKQGHYDIAAQRLDRAREAFEDARVDDGIGQVLHLVGTLAAQRGDYDRARDAYQRSIAVRERLGDLTGIAAALSNLGVVAEYAGDYRESLAFHERALHLRHELGDRWAIAVSFTNIGMIAVHEQRFADAGMAFREAMRLNREVGDLWMVAICHNNLGNALRGVGQYDEARAEYAAAARTYRDYDDHWAMAFLLEDVALLAAEVGLREAAYELVGAADRQREELGSPRAPALETTLTERLSAAAAGDDDAHAARQRGALFDTEQAVSALMSVCVTESSPEI